MLFSIVLEFEGTSSVSQYYGRNVSEAYRKWFQGLSDPGRYGLDRNQAKRLAAELSYDGLRRPTPLNSIVNVWCVTAWVDKSYALLNLVATVAAIRKRTAQWQRDCRDA